MIAVIEVSVTEGVIFPRGIEFRLIDCANDFCEGGDMGDAITVLSGD